MADLGVALRHMGDRANRVQVAMTTVDPTRDTPEVLKNFLEHFFRPGAYHALRTTDAAQLEAVERRFGVTSKVEFTSDGQEAVGHSALMSIVDERGRVRVVWPFGVSSTDMRADLDRLLKERT
jgi:protein SCO1/2